MALPPLARPRAPQMSTPDPQFKPLYGAGGAPQTASPGGGMAVGDPHTMKPPGTLNAPGRMSGIPPPGIMGRNSAANAPGSNPWDMGGSDSLSGAGSMASGGGGLPLGMGGPMSSGLPLGMGGPMSGGGNNVGGPMSAGLPGQFGSIGGATPEAVGPSPQRAQLAQMLMRSGPRS